MTVPIGRFAPSPSGRLHMGNIFSFLVAYIYVRQAGGYMRMRIEDLDQQRSKPEYIQAALHDLDYLGFEWEGPVVYQSQQTEVYKAAFDALQARGLLYPCFCTRAELHAASAPHFGEEVVYAGTCRTLSAAEVKQRTQHKGRSGTMRVKVDANPHLFDDVFQGPQAFSLPECSGDFIIRRSDGVFAYQLAVVVDDAAMNITSVIRGADLLTSTPRQQYLQNILGLPQPEYGHAPLLVDNHAIRLAKRNEHAYLASRIDADMPAASILGELAHKTGLIAEYAPIAIDELVRYVNLDVLKHRRTITWEQTAPNKKCW